MENKKLELNYVLYNTFESMPVEYQKLYNESKEATNNSYAPYSNFNVGAAVLLEGGEIIKGSNQENAAYPSGLCAERTALFYVGSNRSEKIIAVAVAARRENNNFIEDISPCGGCRQVMSEYENKQKEPISFIMPASNGKFIVLKSVKNFLPFEFTRKSLNS